MHYKAFLITKEFPTDEVIEQIMKPFHYEEVYRKENGSRPAFTWDWYEIGGRYNSFFKLDIEATEDKYGWQYCQRRDRQAFRSYLFNELYSLVGGKSWRVEEYKYYHVLGSNDGYIRVDGGLIADMQPFDITSCFIIIDKNGNAFARESWNGDAFVKYEGFDDKAKEIFSDSADCYICTIDIHD